MLVEVIPKEPLSFSVFHYKNPKLQHTVQVAARPWPLRKAPLCNDECCVPGSFLRGFWPHGHFPSHQRVLWVVVSSCLTVYISSWQAKSQQDKRLWVLHLKRLILENHAAKIPAKVGH